MAGRPRTPTPLHLLNGHGNKAAAREQQGEPPAEVVILECPEHLDELERAEWEHYAKLAGEMRVTTREDVDALEQLACVSAACKEMRETIRELRKSNGGADGDDPYTYESTKEDGSIMLRVRPIWTALKDSEKQHLILLGRFGLTPSDRSKVSKIGGHGKSAADLDKEFEK